MPCKVGLCNAEKIAHPGRKIIVLPPRLFHRFAPRHCHRKDMRNAKRSGHMYPETSAGLPASEFNVPDILIPLLVRDGFPIGKGLFGVFSLLLFHSVSVSMGRQTLSRLTPVCVE